MAFPSIPFAYFFLLVFTGAFLLRARPTARNALLLVASYGFYASLHLRLAAWLLLLSLFTWVAGELQSRPRSLRLRCVLLGVGVVGNAGLLAALKLYDFFRESVAVAAHHLGLQAHLPVLEQLAPVGLSFYAVQGIAYLVDRHRGQAARPRALLDFLLFMAFFPKLLAGPICRAQQLLPQLARPTEIADPERAVALVLLGLAKKMVLAAYLSTHLVLDAFQAPETQPWPALVLALFAYSAEIYLDFSGYTDLARGLAALLGFELPENFRAPYAATSIGDFWRRWHMTFSAFLRDHVYIPLGGSRRGPARACLNLVVTMIVCGLWHGASWGFVVWGGLHGLALAAHRLWRARWPASPASPSSLWGRAAGWAGTMLFCALARVFFRSEDLGAAAAFLRGLARPALDGATAGVDPWVVIITVGCFTLSAAGPRLFEGAVTATRRLPRPALPIAWTATAMAVLALRGRDVAPYIYFGF